MYQPQHVLCECGREIPLKPYQETDWTVFEVYCDHCGSYLLVSKFKIQSGKTCPRCRAHRIQVLGKFASTEDVIRILKIRGLEVWRFTGQGEVVKVE